MVAAEEDELEQVLGWDRERDREMENDIELV